MREFLDGLDAADPPVPRDQRVVAALGPKMLDLAAERSLGAHPYFTTVEHTRFARERIGPDALIATEVAVVVDPDPGSAREQARAYAARYLRLTNYAGNLLRFGYTERDLADGGSDRLIDAVIPHGSPERDRRGRASPPRGRRRPRLPPAGRPRPRAAGGLSGAGRGIALVGEQRQAEPLVAAEQHARA